MTEILLPPPELPADLGSVPIVRDPQKMLAQTLEGWNPREDLWVFGYGSLIWRPEIEFVERRLAAVHGYHRALRMWSRINRGSPLCPGLVFALMSGGACKGVVYRVPRERARAEFDVLWHREMPTGVYDAKWLPCKTGEGTVRALAFTLSRNSPNYTGELADSQMLTILGDACGRYGTTLDYVQRTHQGLREQGISDRKIAEVLAFAREHSLING